MTKLPTSDSTMPTRQTRAIRVLHRAKVLVEYLIEDCAEFVNDSEYSVRFAARHHLHHRDKGDKRSTPPLPH